MHYIMRYKRNRLKYEAALDFHEQLVSQREALFQRTQPQAIQIKADKIMGSGSGNPLEDYAIRSQQLDERIKKAAKLVWQRRNLLKRAESDLRASKGTWDRIFVYHYLENRKIPWIAMRMGYSERQVYRILQKIQDVSKCQ